MYNLSADNRAVQRWIEGIAMGEAANPPFETPGANLAAILNLWRELGGKQGPHDRHSLRSLEAASSVKSVTAKARGRVNIDQDEANALILAMLKSWRYDKKSKKSVPIKTSNNINPSRLANTIVSDIFKGEENITTSKSSSKYNVTLADFLPQRVENSHSVIFGHSEKIIIDDNDFGLNLPYFHRFYWNVRPFAFQDQTEDRCLMIFVVDIGHYQPTETHFSYFNNTASLATHLRSLAYFNWDDVTDSDIIDSKGELKNTFDMLKSVKNIGPATEQGLFWKRVNDNVCVIVRGWDDYVRRLDGIFEGDVADSEDKMNEEKLSDELRRLFGTVSSENFLPREIPRSWEGHEEMNSIPHEHSFRLIASLEKKSSQVKFFSLAEASRSKSSKTRRQEARSSRSLTMKEIELSPGKPYERAIEIMTWAARFRLGLLNNDDGLVGQNAVALLAAHGFSVLRVADFVRARRSN